MINEIFKQQMEAQIEQARLEAKKLVQDKIARCVAALIEADEEKDQSRSRALRDIAHMKYSGEVFEEAERIWLAKTEARRNEEARLAHEKALQAEKERTEAERKKAERDKQRKTLEESLQKLRKELEFEGIAKSRCLKEIEEDQKKVQKIRAQAALMIRGTKRCYVESEANVIETCMSTGIPAKRIWLQRAEENIARLQRLISEHEEELKKFE
jgi:hypothetical protein